MMLSDDHLRHLVPMPPPPCGCAPRPWPRPAVPVPITPQMQPHWAEELRRVLDGKQDAISDLDDIREGARAGATAYQKPEDGVPETDLSEDVQASLNKADSAVQPDDILSGGKVKSDLLPSYVDDVIEVADYASLPDPGEEGKIYVTLDTNIQYRWGGTQYTEIAKIIIPSASAPLVDGTASAGSSEAYSRGDHRHPTDTSRMAAGATGADIPVDATQGAQKINAALADKANRASNPTAGDLAALDANGNLTDSGIPSAVVPSAATAQNKLVDTQTMNSSIATNTANFLGTYSYVTDLGFPQPSSAAGVDNAAIATALGELAFPQTPTNNDYVFVSINYAPTTDVDEFRRFKFNGTAGTWSYEYTLNNSSFTAAQWAAINSGITSGDVTKLAGIAAGAQVNVIEGVKVNGTALTPTNKVVDVVAMPATATGADIPVDATQGAQKIDVALAGKANDNAVVHLAGDETVGGYKTFTNLATFNSGVMVYGGAGVEGMFYVSFGPNYGDGYWYIEKDIDGNLTLNIQAGDNSGTLTLPFNTGTLALVSQIPDVTARLQQIAAFPAFDATASYAVGDMVTYQGQIYECTTAHSGEWSAGDFTARTLGYLLGLKQTKITASGLLKGDGAGGVTQAVAGTDYAGMGNLPYAISESIPLTVTSGAASTTLDDRIHNVRTVAAPGSGNTTTITATLPPIVAGKSRDMFLNLTVGTQASDAGDISLSIVEPSGATVQIEIGSVEDIGIGKNEILISENALPTTSGNVTTTHWLVTVRHEDFAS